jgi:hypothetical protein
MMGTEMVPEKLVSSYHFTLLIAPEDFIEQCMRFEILTAVKMSMMFVWIVTPCGLVGR